MSSLQIKHEIFELSQIQQRFVFDPIGPIKLEAIDWISQITRLQVDLLQKLERVERHLEVDAPAGRAFVRSQERPDVTGAALGQQQLEATRLLTERVAALEQKIS